MNRVAANRLSFCALLLAGWAFSCGTKADLNGDQDPTAFRVPVTKSFALTESKPIEWQVIDPDSIDLPQTYPLDIDKMPSQPFSISEFKPLKPPMEESPLDWDPNNRIKLQFDTIPIEKKISILPSPVVSIMNQPSVLSGTSSVILQLSMSEGLPSNDIRKIIQNEDGTYWIATFDGGLSLYNGNELYTYDYKRIWDIEIDQYGKLWMATENGIYVLDFKKKTQTNFLSSRVMLSLLCDHQNQIWMTHWQKGTYVMDSDMEHLRRITNPGFTGIRPNYPLMEDRNHNIWLLSQSGNQTVTSIIGEDRQYYTNFLPYGGYHFQDRNNRVWMTSVSGTFGISLDDKTVRTLSEKDGYNEKAQFWEEAQFYEEDNQGRLWIINSDSIHVLNKGYTKMKSIATNSPVRFGNTIKDKRGVIWIGTASKGILLVNPDGPLPEVLGQSDGLMDGQIRSLEEDHRGDIWLGTPKGINIYSPTTKTLKAIDEATLQIPYSNNIFFISEFEKDNFFIDGDPGFLIINRAEKLLTHYLETQNFAQRIFGALKDEEGSYWLATDNGLAVYNPVSNELKTIPEESPQLDSDWVSCILDDGSGRYWLGTTNGLVIIDPDKNTIQYLREQEGLSHNIVHEIIQREDGTLWVATDDGISIIDPVSQTITNLGEAEGLVPEVAYSLQQKDSTLYIGSVDGLMLVNPPADPNTPWNFFNYSAGQGFLSNDYNRRVSLLLPNGQLWFGAGPNWKLTILTQDPVIDTVSCPVYITGLTIMDDKRSFDRMADLRPYFETGDTLWSSDVNQLFTKNTLPQDSGYVSEHNIQWDSLSSPYKLPIGLQLPYDQNYLRFSFANLCVLNRDKISFRYMLAGADDAWIYTGQEPQSKNYFNLSPGTYTFRVATKGIKGQWGDPAEFSFRIFPPWWQTWWAYALYLILTVLGLYFLVRWRTRALVSRSRELEGIVSARTRELKKRVEELQLINHLSRAAASELERDKLIQLIGEEMQDSFHAQVGYIAWLDEPNQMIHFPYLRGVEVPSLRVGQGLTSKILLTGEPLLINEDVQGVYDRLGLETVTDIPESYLGVPIPVGGQNLGVISVSRTEAAKPFDEEDKSLLMTIAANVGIAIRNAELYQEAQLAKAQAEAANEAKSNFLSTVSHELRTPLTSVIGFAKIIKKRLEGRIFPLIESDDAKVNKTIEQVSTNLGVVITEGERLTQLINDVLDLAKIEAGKIEWNMESVAVSEVIEKAIASTQALFAGKSLSLEKDIAADLPLITGDRNKLIQVMINLISNAVKFTGSGTITVGAYRNTPLQEITISITDTGIGIAPEDQPRVFEKFKQVGDTLTDKPQGTGLGLPICKEIIEHHGGRIWLESEPGTGSTFFFSLPLTAGVRTVPDLEINQLLDQLKTQIQYTPLVGKPEKRTILIVDDDTPIRSLLRQELSEAGYAIREAENGRAALESVRRERPDLVILDVMMPEMNGFDVAAVLKNDPQTMDLPIIILSIVQDEKRGFRIGVDRYLTKPIDTGQLFTEVDQLLHQGKSRKKVLVVDEDVSAARTLTQVLQERGYQVEESDGQALLEKIQVAQPDIVILSALLNQDPHLIQTLRFEKGLEKVLFFIYH